jgi:tripartite-type tricarboxylate transporter receptor subunit TctC
MTAGAACCAGQEPGAEELDMHLIGLMLLAGAGLAFQAQVASAQTSLPTSSSSGRQTWPHKPIRAVVPYAAGSTTDIVPRVVFEQLAIQLGQPIIVDNRAGAGGTIGAALVARSEADGHTLLVNSSAHAIAPSFIRGWATTRRATSRR